MSTLSTFADAPVVEVPCYLCGSKDAGRLFQDGPYGVWRCRSCSLVYTSPRLGSEAIREIYQTAYWQSDQARDFGYTDYLSDRPLYLKTFRKRIRVLTRRKPRGRVLEIGSAGGFFLEVARERGYEVHGVELSGWMADRSRERLGKNAVTTGTIEDLKAPRGSFDVVALWDVVEHLEDPLPVLVRARELLKPDGLLVLETQNIESCAARLMGRRWTHFKQLEHLYHFSPRTITRLLHQAGFRVLELSAARAGKYVSLAFLIERMQRVAPLLHKLLLPLRPLGRMSCYVNPRDEVIVVAAVEPAAGSAR
jgi:2-polyprenyl-3-methyl-5-hydroxy-6-metoxy-1,4-benzoquinol methylase